MKHLFVRKECGGSSKLDGAYVAKSNYFSYNY